MEISNKTLAWLVVAAIVVSVFGTTMSLWNLNNKESFAGYVTLTNSTAGATVGISQSVILRFAINATNFGSGSVNSGAGYWGCNMGINASSTTIYQNGCTGFNPSGNALVIENVGTSYMNVTLNITGNATTFLGNSPSDAIGSGAFMYEVSDNESGSCVGTKYNTSWTIVQNGTATAISPILICSNLSYAVSSNSLAIGLNITLTNNATPGAKFVVFTAQGTNI